MCRRFSSEEEWTLQHHGVETQKEYVEYCMTVYGIQHTTYIHVVLYDTEVTIYYFMHITSERENR